MKLVKTDELTNNITEKYSPHFFTNQGLTPLPPTPNQGLAPAMCSVCVFWSFYFPCYDYAKAAIARGSGLGVGSPTVHVSAACAAGLLTDVLTNPLWVVRTRLATQALRGSALAAEHTPYNGMAQAFRRIAAEEGPMAFFTGEKIKKTVSHTFQFCPYVISHISYTPPFFLIPPPPFIFFSI
tara:strand:+ start:110 stop:655 length:546 start_codon:yes stop_codon:yes gene_type:complete